MSEWYCQFGVTKSQWRYYRFWLIALLLAEGTMLCANKHLFEIYLVIALLFLCGFILRVLRLYPGESEPLILDCSAVVLALGYAFLGFAIKDSIWRFLLILCSSTIIMPHLIFIAKENVLDKREEK